MLENSRDQYVSMDPVNYENHGSLNCVLKVEKPYAYHPIFQKQSQSFQLKTIPPFSKKKQKVDRPCMHMVQILVIRRRLNALQSIDYWFVKRDKTRRKSGRILWTNFDQNHIIFMPY